MAAFLAILAANSLLYLFVGLVEIPTRLVTLASLLVSIFAVCLPISALYVGASASSRWTRWVAFGVVGLATQFGLAALAANVKNPLGAGVLFALSQDGLIVWCLGLGGLVASAIRDKNLLLPLAAFLAIFDFWLVFVPEGPVGKIARSNPAILGKIAYVIPKVAEVSHGGHAASWAYIGPADFMFIGMFFVALYRFNMRARATFQVVAPVLALYLLVVLFAKNIHIGPISLSAMPALIPIGATVLIVNRKEFKLTKDESISSAAIIIIGIVVVAWRFNVNRLEHQFDPRPPAVEFVPPNTQGDGSQGPQPGPLPPGVDPRSRTPQGSPPQLPPNQFAPNSHPSGSPRIPA